MSKSKRLDSYTWQNSFFEYYLGTPLERIWDEVVNGEAFEDALVYLDICVLTLNLVEDTALLPIS